MASILGLQGVEKIAPQIDEVLAGDASYVEWQWGDSNLSQQTGNGYAHARRKTLETVLGLPVIATHNVTAGNFANGGTSLNYAGSGASEFFNDSIAADQAAYSGQDADVQPYLPVEADTAAADIFEPVCMKDPASSPGGCRTTLAHEATARGYNWNERTKIWMSHFAKTGQNTHNWRCRAQTGSFTHASGSINHATGGPGVILTNLGQIAAGSWNTNSPSGVYMQMLPMDNNPTITGECSIFSMFATWPDRGHGFIVCPLFYTGGQSFNLAKKGLDAAEPEYIEQKLLSINAALEGRRGHLVVTIQSLLGDRADADSDTEAEFLAVLTTAIDTLLSIYDAYKATGAIPNIATMTIMFEGPLHRINDGGSITFGYNAARTLEAIRSRFCVADFQDMMTDAESNVICTDGSHLTSAANYLMQDKRWFARFITACRLAQRLREVPT